MVPAAPGDAVEIRIVRRSRTGCVDEDQDRGARWAGAPLRTRPATPRAHRQRRQVGCEQQRRCRALDRSGYGRPLSQPDDNRCGRGLSSGRNAGSRANGAITRCFVEDLTSTRLPMKKLLVLVVLTAASVVA